VAKDILLCCAGLTAIFILPTIIVALVWRRGRRRETRTHDEWLQLANNLGLSYEPKKNILRMPVAGSVHGKYRGRHLFLSSFIERSPLLVTLLKLLILVGTMGKVAPGAEEERFYRLWIALGQHQQGKISLSRKRAFNKLVTIPRGDDIRTGHTQFDETFKINADSDEAVRRVFSSAFLRRRLIRSPTPSFEVHDDRIESFLPQKAHDSEYWQSILDVLCDIAEAVENS
jgi:hypothetical protein